MSDPTPKKYRIVQLKVQNVKRLKAVDILPHGNMVSIGGQNDNGKTSVLDSIMFALGGAGTICERPLRDGTSKGEILVDLGDMRVTRTFKSAAASTLKIEMADGTPVSSPQSILDALASKISFDPLAFTLMKPVQQLETLRSLVGLDFTKIDAERKKQYDARTTVNRELEQAKARRNTMATHPDAPKEPVSVKALMEQQTAIRNANSANTKVREALKDLQQVQLNQQASYDKSMEDVERLEAQLAEARALRTGKLKRLEDIDGEIKVAQANVDALSDKDAQPIIDQINAADETNTKVRENAARAEACKKIDELDTQSQTITEAIEAIDKDKQDQLAACKFPLPGLSFDESGVLLDSVPFSQAGMAKKILASLAIAKALNPKLPVILIRDGSLLDDNSMELLSKFASEHDLQVWIEVCHNLGKASVIIHDGMIKETEEATAKA